VSEKPVLTSSDANGVVTVTFNRPHVNNAYDGDLLHAVLAGLDTIERGSTARVLVLKGNGRHFQAGADLTWINGVRKQDLDANLDASRNTAAVVDRLNRLPIPVVALVQGACFGGGTGVLAACDVVIAAENAIFSIAEVRWGLHPAIIIPHLVDAIGVRQARRYALTGERFDAREACRIGLVHEVVPMAELEARGAKLVAQILENGPKAIATTKKHILESAESGFSPSTIDYLIHSHATARQSAEAREGLASFAEKRRAAWAPKE
jgi:methylglutaconyl-CoA hydratase